jgi:hypothetical protein
MKRRALPIAVLAGSLTAATAVVLGSPGTAHAAGFGASVLVSDDNVSEPAIDVAPDGTLYVNGPVGVLSNIPGSPSEVWRSDDGATSWSKLPASLKANLPGGGDADIVVLPNGNLAETDLWLGDSTVATSTDKGQTWLANPLQGVVGQDRQWVAATSSAVYHVVHQIPTGLILSKSLDGGLTYQVHNVAATALDQTGCVCPPGNMVAESGGLTGDRVGGVYNTTTSGTKFWRTTNGGLTFTQTNPSAGTSTDTGQGFPVVADGGNGKLAVVWTAIQGGQEVTMFTTSTDFGATWAQARAIVTTGTSAYPWVDYKAGKIAISLYHNDAVATQDTTPSGSPWYVNYLESTDGGTTFTALAAADSVPVKTEPICSGGINCSANRELGDFQQVAIDGAGHGLLSYARSIDNVSDTEIRVVKEA